MFKYLALVALLPFAIQRLINLRLYQGAYRKDENEAPHPDFDVITIVREDGKTRNLVTRVLANARYNIIYLHGNGARATEDSHKLDVLTRRNTNVFAVEYTGYGAETGNPSEAQLRADVDAAFGFVRANYGDLPIVVLGFSLGAATALVTSPHTKPDGVIVLAPFTSTADMAPKGTAPLLVGNRFEALTAAKGFDAPIAIVHARGDPTIPVDHARQIADVIDEERLVYFATPEWDQHHLPIEEIAPAIAAMENRLGLNDA